MITIAIDPGHTRSAMVVLIGTSPRVMLLEDNALMLERLVASRLGGSDGRPVHLAIEMVASYGMAVGREVFETCVWIGRFIEAWKGPYTQVYRLQVKQHLCHRANANDSNIRQALVDRYGGNIKAAKGTMHARGPLYGIKDDLWAALAVGLTYQETMR